MKSYPSIPGSTGKSFRAIPAAYIFDKLDGSNIRAEWSLKSGWGKFGTRSGLLDPTNPVFGSAIPTFHEYWEDRLTKVARDQRWQRVVCFFEFWGPSSFAGQHDPSEEKRLTLIDVAPYKVGILGPRAFLDLFDDVDRPQLLGVENWNREFVEAVRNSEIVEITFEGVVAKAGSGHHLIMAKAKTQRWIDKVRSLYDPEAAEKIIAS